MPTPTTCRYDPVAKRLYVGYGAGARAALAVVDPAAMERLQEFKVGSHPEFVFNGSGRPADFR